MSIEPTFRYRREHAVKYIYKTTSADVSNKLYSNLSLDSVYLHKNFEAERPFELLYHVSFSNGTKTVKEPFTQRGVLSLTTAQDVPRCSSKEL